jgi:hypothetical protein
MRALAANLHRSCYIMGARRSWSSCLWAYAASMALFALGCHKPKLIAPSVGTPQSASFTRERAPVAVPVVVSRVHAFGVRGSVAIVICGEGGSARLGLKIAPNDGLPGVVALDSEDASTTDAQIRFVDVDHDGFPDPVVSALDRKAPGIVTVHLTSKALAEAAGNVPAGLGGCSALSSLEVDHGSEGYLVHARTLDEAVTALAALDSRAITPSQACAFLEQTPHPAFEIYDYPNLSSKIEKRSREPKAKAIIKCRILWLDGNTFLSPLLTCDDFRAYCEFGLAVDATILPPTERRYWFDPAAGKLLLVGVPLL